MNDWLFFSLEGVPARIKTANKKAVSAEIYKLGKGFIAGPQMTILDQGQPLSRAEFDKLLMQFIRKTEA